MSLHAAAKHLASKGRNGDTTLVHMTKGEVAGLQALAKKHGTSLTVNPHTGLPEAFSLKSLVPMAAGAAMTYFSGGAINPMMAAGIMGLGTTAATGSLSKGMMAGLGAYGGAGLGAGLGAMGTEAGTAAAAGEAEAAGAKAIADEQAKQAVMQEAATGVGAPPPLAPTVSPEASLQSTLDYTTNQAGNTFELNGGYRPTFGPEATSTQLPGATTDAVIPSNTGFSASTQQTLAQPPMQSGLEAAYKNPGAYVDKLGGGMQTAKLAGMAAAPVVADAMAPRPYQEPDIKGDADMGQRYAYDSGYDNSVPERTGQPAYKAISNEEAKKLYGFADGGDVQYPYNEPVVRMATGGASAAAAPSSVGYTGNVGDYSAADAAGARGGYGLGVDYSGYATPVAPMAGISAAAPARKASAVAAPTKGLAYDPSTRSYVGSTTDADYLGGGQYGKTQAEKDAEAEAYTAPVAYPSDGGGGAANGGLMQAYANGGSTLGGYSDGGRLLRGPGDGVSDSIPAVIGRKQPARLADGEFVVPARIVSEIGNGSTEAGARKLYAMMDRVQKARGKTVGKGKVAKNTRADKFLPA